jgi:hypothetical protein
MAGIAELSGIRVTEKYYILGLGGFPLWSCKAGFTPEAKHVV